MAKTARWGGLRNEPYNPFPPDADSDEVVQEGTAFERPKGTRILDALGRELVPGHTSNVYIPGIQYVDNGGNIVDFVPSGRQAATPGAPGSQKVTGLSKLGHPSLKDRGSQSILDIQKAARAQAVTPPPFSAPVVAEVGRKDLAATSMHAIEEKASARRRRLRIEPYDPDAKDGDGDGIVQDGTAWERPAGTRIITSLGREVARGMTTTRPSRLNRIVDSDGNSVDYVPKWRRPLLGLERVREAREARLKPRSAISKRSAAVSLPKIPPEPGSTPIPDGWVRLYHYTGDNSGDMSIQEILDSIRANGLQLSRSRGSAMFEEGDFVWASTKMPTDRYFVEFAIPSDDPRVAIGGFVGNVGLGADVLPEEILAIHEPWHGKYRYMTADPDFIQRVLDGEYDHLLDMPEYGEAIERIKKEFYLREQVIESPVKPTPEKGPSSPLGQLGYPTLSERGLATIDDMVPPPGQEPPDVADSDFFEEDLADAEPEQLSDTARAIEEYRQEASKRPNPPFFLPDLPDVRAWPPVLPYEFGRIPSETIYNDDPSARDPEGFAADAVNYLAYFLIDQIESLANEGEEGAFDAFAEAIDYRGNYYELINEIVSGIKRRAAEFGLKIAREGVVKVNLTADDLLKVLDQGRYKSQFETGRSGGIYNLSLRTDTELYALGIPDDIDDTLRPVYGSVEVDESQFEAGVNEGGGVNGYGNIRMILKPDVKDRTTFVIGDSLVASQHLATAVPLNEGKDLTPDAYIPTALRRETYFLLYDILRLYLFLDEGEIEINGESIDVEELLRELSFKIAFYPDTGPPVDYPWHGDYIEAQVHGGVSVLDIDEIILPNGLADYMLNAIVSRAERLRIKVRNVSGEYFT